MRPGPPPSLKGWASGLSFDPLILVVLHPPQHDMILIESHPLWSDRRQQWVLQGQRTDQKRA